MNNRNLILFAGECMKVFGIYPDDFAEKELLEIGIALDSRHKVYQDQSNREAKELNEATHA
jgi:hypothetical protein